MKTCVIDGCANKQQARGWCNTHYWLWNTYGDPLAETPKKRKERIVRDAVEAGARLYFTGEPCLRGHVAARIVGGQCVECRKLAIPWRKRSEANRLSMMASVKKWTDANRGRARDLVRAWDSANRARKNEHRATRRAAQISATPAWANRKEIAKIYARAIELTLLTGIPHEVDHAIPLKGKSVCGLHVETNLQILTMVENRSKHVKFADGAAV